MAPMPGARARSASPPWVGMLPPATASYCIEMVPPVNRRWITASAAQHAATVHVEHLAGDVPCRRAREEQDGPGDILRARDSLERNPGLDPRPVLGGEDARGHVSVDPSRGAAVHSDVG